MSNRKIGKDHLGNEFESINDMCRHLGVARTTFDRRLNKGYSLCDALTEKTSKKVFEDHLGNKYDSLNDMLSFYNITRAAYRTRLKHGYNLEQALTGKDVNCSVNGNKCIDHLGNVYDSIGKMCMQYGVSVSTYKRRIFKGYSIESSLTGKGIQKNSNANPIQCQDHLGNWFYSVSELCSYYEIPRSVYEYRRRNKWDIERILTTDVKTVKSVKDHKGVEYDSLSSMCNTYNIALSTFTGRLKAGYNLKQSLTGIGVAKVQRKCKDHLGNSYENIESMCKAWNVSYATYKFREDKGYDIKTCLTGIGLHKQHKIRCVDHLGNVYESEKELCNAYGISRDTYRRKSRDGKGLLEILEERGYRNGSRE